MEGNQDREFRMSEYVYPNPRDSRVVEPNPAYHPPIYFIGGRFCSDAKGAVEMNLDDVPDYVIDRITGEQLAPAPARPHVTLSARPEDYDRSGGSVGAETLLRDLAAANAAEVAPRKVGRPKADPATQ